LNISNIRRVDTTIVFDVTIGSTDIDEKFLISDINIFPNPSDKNTTISFELESAGDLKIVLDDILGQKIMEIFSDYSEAGVFTKTFSMEALPQGFYYIKIGLTGNVKIEKVIKN
jgi:hypothetical protein